MSHIRTPEHLRAKNKRQFYPLVGDEFGQHTRNVPGALLAGQTNFIVPSYFRDDEEDAVPILEDVCITHLDIKNLGGEGYGDLYISFTRFTYENDGNGNVAGFNPYLHLEPGESFKGDVYAPELVFGAGLRGPSNLSEKTAARVRFAVFGFGHTSGRETDGRVGWWRP